jgi:predicted ATPase with chaperone activity
VFVNSTSSVCGPLLDRIDIQFEVPGLRYQELASKDAGESSNLIRERVNQARQIQLQRFDKIKIHANAQMGAKEIKRHCAVKEDADKLLETAINKLGLSARAYSRVLKVGRTIADLAGSENVEHRTSPKRFSIGVWIGACEDRQPSSYIATPGPFYSPRILTTSEGSE